MFGYAMFTHLNMVMLELKFTAASVGIFSFCQTHAAFFRRVKHTFIRNMVYKHLTVAQPLPIAGL